MLTVSTLHCAHSPTEPLTLRARERATESDTERERSKGLREADIEKEEWRGIGRKIWEDFLQAFMHTLLRVIQKLRQPHQRGKGEEYKREIG